MKGFTVLFFKKSQESCFSGTSGNSGGDWGGDIEAGEWGIPTHIGMYFNFGTMN